MNLSPATSMITSYLASLTASLSYEWMNFQVPPAELEHLLQSIPAVADAAVIPYVILSVFIYRLPILIALLLMYQYDGKLILTLLSNLYLISYTLHFREKTT